MLRVSVVIPARNEEKTIAAVLESLREQDYPRDAVEIMVVDGMSDDSTRDVVQGYAQKDGNIKYVANERIITPCAFNLGIKNASGDVVVVMGAHTRYSKNYLSTIVKYIESGEADCVGSVADTLPAQEGVCAPYIIESLSSSFGVGNSYMRTGVDKPRYVDVASCPGYSMAVFNKIGLFNEQLKHSQDVEFSMRMKAAGLRTLLAPEIISHYYARSRLKPFIKHNFRNGLWSILPFAYTDVVPISWRHLVPCLFVLTVMTLALSSWAFSKALWVLVGLMGVYLAAACYSALSIAVKRRRVRYAIVMPVFFILLHFSYGIGSLVGIVRSVVSRSFWKRRFNWLSVKLQRA